MGLACALQLARAGHRVVARVRREVDDHRLASLKARSFRSCWTSPDQLTSKHSSRLDEFVIAGLGGLVNNNPISVVAVGRVREWR
jgi:glycine/D-amino acid oxidase-like deaminating enzyme